MFSAGEGWIDPTTNIKEKKNNVNVERVREGEIICSS